LTPYLLRTIAVAIALSLLVTPDLAAKELEDKKWLLVTTPNFQIRSMMSKRRTLEVARKLESFRVVAGLLTNAGMTESRVPVEIFAIDGGKAVKTFNLENAGGRFYDGVRRHTIVVQEYRGEYTTRTMLHEYVHFLSRNYSTSYFPKWFEEGLAEFLSSARFRGDEIHIGGAENWMRQKLMANTVPLSDIIERRGEDNWPTAREHYFYSVSWAIVHYLQNRPDQETPFDEQLRNHVQLLESGVGAIEAFETAFGITIPGLAGELQRYLSNNRVPVQAISVEGLIPEFEYEVSQLSREEISLALGNHAMTIRKYDMAERWFEIAANDESLSARANAGLSGLLRLQNKIDEAKALLDLAISLAPNDPHCHLDMAAYWFDLAGQDDNVDHRDEYLAYARQHFVRAWELDKSAPEPYAAYGTTFVVEGKNYARAIDMLEQARRILGSNVEIRWMLAEAYLGAGDYENAAEHAGAVLAWSHSEWAGSKRVREILDTIIPAATAEAEETEESR